MTEDDEGQSGNTGRLGVDLVPGGVGCACCGRRGRRGRHGQGGRGRRRSYLGGVEIAGSCLVLSSWRVMDDIRTVHLGFAT